MSVYRRIKVLQRKGFLTGNGKTEIISSFKEDNFNETVEEDYEVEKEEEEEEAEVDDNFVDEVEEDEKPNFDIIDHTVISEDEDYKSSKRKRKLKDKIKREEFSEEEILP